MGVVFYRDRKPVGWNVANGGSENKTEYTDLYGVIGREFAEETVIVHGAPLGRGSGETETLYQHPFDTHETMLADHFEVAKLLSVEHNGLRRLEDGLKFERHNDPIWVDKQSTDLRAEILYENKQKIAEDLLISINPSEFGVETIWHGRLNLCNDDYVLDGEVTQRETLLDVPSCS